MQQQTAGLYLKAKVREKHPKLFVLLNLLSAGWLLRFFVWFWLVCFGFVFCLVFWVVFFLITGKHFSSSLSQVFAS